VDGVADLVVEVPDGLQHGLHLLGPHRRGTLGPEGSRTFGRERGEGRGRGERGGGSRGSPGRFAAAAAAAAGSLFFWLLSWRQRLVFSLAE
jgi:hypothetical protein